MSENSKFELIFSIIIPVYNRPDEIDELLESLTKQTYSGDYEVIVVEDGSIEKCDAIVENYKTKLKVRYLFKENTGAGLSRNFGMKNASGNYFIILDSDVIVPPSYLESVEERLSENFTDAFGGPDAAHKSFSNLQKAINYSMTSFLTTGGIRGGKERLGKFQLRSFNLGVSKKAFLETGGFSNRKIGEDIDFTFRLWEKGFKTQLIADAFVYHKRRTSLSQFLKQTYRFGRERPILNKQYPSTAKITFWFPSFFILGVFVSFIAILFFCYYPVFLLSVYFIAIIVDSTSRNKSILIGLLSVLTTVIQFTGYGVGFLQRKISS